MADLEIRIGADASTALNALDGVEKSLNQLRKEVVQSANAYSAGTGGLDGYLKASQALQNAIQKKLLVTQREGADVKALSRLYQELGRVQDAVIMGLADQGAGINTWLSGARASVSGMVDELRKADEAVKSLGDFKGRASGSDNVAFYDLAGDELGKQKAILEEYGKTLRSTIKTFGSASGEASEVADAYREQSEAVKALEESTRKASSRIGNLIKSFVSAQAIVWAMQAAFRTLRNAIVDWSAAAAAAEETANLFNTTFGEISTTAGKVSRNLASSLGMANSTMQESLGLFGDMAMGYGQTQAAALEFAETAARAALDIMSFKNVTGDVSEIMQTFASGLAGNFENFRKWGIIVTQAEIKARLMEKGLSDLTGTALQYAKIQETLNIVMEKSANAMGDMERTLDSTENINRRLAEANKGLMEELGEGLNTVLNPLKEMWMDIADQIRLAMEYQDAFNKGQAGAMSLEGGSGRKAFANQVLHSDFSFQTLNFFDDNEGPLSYFIRDSEKFAEGLVDVMRVFDASVEDVLSVLDEYNVKYDDAFVKSLESASEDLEAGREAREELERLTASFADAQGETTNFIDTLAGISGVRLGADYAANAMGISAPGTEGQLSTREGLLGRYARTAVDDAIDSILGSPVSDFFSMTDLQFGDLGEADALEARMESLSDLYEALYNAVKTGQASYEGVNSQLSRIVSEYGKLADKAESLEEAASAQAAILSAQSSAGDARASIDKLGMSDGDAAVYDIKAQMEEALAKIESPALEDAVREAFGEWMAATEEYHAALEDNELVQSHSSEMEGLASSIAGVKAELAALGQTPMEQAVAEINAQRDALIESRNWTAGQAEALNAEFDRWVEVTEALYAEQSRLEAEETEKARAQNAADAIAGIADSADEVAKSLAQLDMTELEKALDDINRQEASLDRNLYTGEEWRALADQFELWRQQTGKLYKARQDAADAEAAAAKAQAANESMADIMASFAGGQTSYAADRAALDDALSQGGDKASYNDAVKAMEEYYAGLAEAALAAFGASSGLAREAARYSNPYGEGTPQAEAYAKVMDTGIGALDDLTGKLRDYGWEEAEITELTNGKLEELADAANEAAKATGNLLPFWERRGARYEGFDFPASVMESLGEFGKMLDMVFSSSGIGAFVSTFATLLSQTEAFTALATILTDSVLPVINAFLEPLLPLVGLFGDLLQNLATAVLEPLFPVLKLLAEAGALAVGVLNVLAGFISDSFKWVFGNLSNIFLSFVNAAIDMLQGINIFGWRPFKGLKNIDQGWAEDWAGTDILGNAKDRWDDTVEALEKIHGMTMEIADNTEADTDLSDLKKVYEAGLISAAEYAGLAADKLGREYDAGLAAAEAGSVGSVGGTYVTYGGVTIVVQGAADAKETAKEVMRQMRKLERNSTYANAV